LGHAVPGWGAAAVQKTETQVLNGEAHGATTRCYLPRHGSADRIISMLQALEQIRRMRGGAQAHLMRCSDGNYYVVKFQNNPQHRRILVNEMLGTRLASRLGLPTAPVSVVEVPEELIRLTAELCIETPRSRIPCTAGLQFGSRYPGDPRRMALHDFLPDEKLREVDNLHEFAGMLVFDKWTCNTNGRQTVFFEKPRGAGAFSPGAGETQGKETAQAAYHTMMIDQGFCFNAGEWNFPDAPLRGLYARNRVYEGVTGMESFTPWLERLEKQITERVLAELAEEIPPAWYEDDYDALVRLLEQIHRRRERVPELILAAQKSNRQPFWGWRQ
jgi:hypothetical protein